MSTIESASFVIIDNDGDPVDSLYTDDVQMSGLGGTEGASILAAGTDWTLDSEVPESFTLITIVRADDRVWVRQAKTTLPIMEGLDPIQLDIEIEELGEGKLRLTLLAHRVDDAPVTERLPNGEKFRLTIFDGYNPIWSSSDGKVFTSAIEKVEPQDIGDREEWVVEWEGSAKSGDLTIEGRIPAAPSPYVVRKGYRYGGR